jgi:hypothetical protein
MSENSINYRWLVLGLFFALIGTPILIWGLYYWKLYYHADSWETIPTQIMTVELEISGSSSGNGNTYSVKCSYYYIVNKRRYVGIRVGIVGGSSDDYSFHEERYRLLKKHMDTHETFPALVDPEDPRQSLLFRETGFIMYILPPFGLCFFLAGCILIAIGLKGTRSRVRKLGQEEYGEVWYTGDDAEPILGLPSTFVQLENVLFPTDLTFKLHRTHTGAETRVNQYTLWLGIVLACLFTSAIFFGFRFLGSKAYLIIFPLAVGALSPIGIYLFRLTRHVKWKINSMEGTLTRSGETIYVHNIQAVQLLRGWWHFGARTSSYVGELNQIGVIRGLMYFADQGLNLMRKTQWKISPDTSFEPPFPRRG